jgi:hypothetical protein
MLLSLKCLWAQVMAMSFRVLDGAADEGILYVDTG